MELFPNPDRQRPRLAVIRSSRLQLQTSHARDISTVVLASRLQRSRFFGQTAFSSNLLNLKYINGAHVSPSDRRIQIMSALDPILDHKYHILDGTFGGLHIKLARCMLVLTANNLYLKDK